MLLGLIGDLYRKIIFCVLLITVFVFGADVDVIAGYDDDEIMGNYEKAAENNNLCLYMNKKTGDFGILNKNNYYVWWSNPPDANEDKTAKGLQKMNLSAHIIVNYVNHEKNTCEYANNYIYSIRKDAAEIKSIKNGFIVNYDFPKQKFNVPLKYTLENDYLNVELLVSEIEERGTNSVFSVNLLPYFGAGNTEDKGYIFVPDGSGALIDMNNGKVLYDNYSQEIYGYDNALFRYKDINHIEKARMPVFGIKKENNALFAIITEDDAEAVIKAESGGKLTSYNSAYAEFKLRRTDSYVFANTRKSDIDIFQKGPFGIEKCEIRYYILEGENTGYKDMAEKYRDYLVAERGIKKTCTTENKFYIDLYGAVIKKKPILGIPVSVIQPLTGYNEAVEMLNIVKEAGIDNIVVKYNNWSRESITNSIPERVKIEKRLGGAKNFNNMLQAFHENDIEIYGGINLLKVSKGSGLLSRFIDFAKNIRGIPISLYPNKLSTYVQDQSVKALRLTASNKIPEYAEDYCYSYGKLEMDGAALNDMGNILYSDFRNEGACMAKTKVQVEEAYRAISEKAVSIIGDGVNAYALPYVDHIVNIPVCSSNFDIVDRDIPFYQMVVHGLVPYSTEPVNLSANPTELFLKAVQTGSHLHYSWIYRDSVNLKDSELDFLYGAEYKSWMKTAVQQYEKLKIIHRLTGDKFITDFVYITPYVTKTVYEGGVNVIVNFNKTAAVIDGVIVDGRSFRVIKGGEIIV